MKNTLEPIDNISLQTLQKVTYQLTSEFSINFDKQRVVCEKLIRAVPGKRLVFLGKSIHTNQAQEETSTEAVIIKLFVHTSRAKKHWLRECNGAKLLSEKKILTPEIIAEGLSDEGIYYLIFPYIEGKSLAEFWKEEDTCGRENKLKSLMPVLLQHHNAGLLHQDLHYANFYLGEKDQIYTLDGEEVKASFSSLSFSMRLKNLALLLAQTFDMSKNTCLSLLENYLQLMTTSGSIGSSKKPINLEVQDKERFWRLIKQYQKQRISQYLKKILRNCSDVIYEKQTKRYTLCRREAHTAEIQKLLAQPEAFFQHENSTFLKRGNTCTIKTVLIDKETYVVKRYNPKGITYELKHKGQKSRARKSWINAHLLRFMGILTPEPIALIEQTPALGKRCSYYISKYIPGQNSWDFFCDESSSEKYGEEPDKESANDAGEKKERVANKELAADAFVNVFKLLCEYQITHGDLKGSNFIVHDNNIWILDMDGMRRHKTNWRFTKRWLRDKQRFFRNWENKPCYNYWKLYFQKALSNEHHTTESCS